MNIEQYLVAWLNVQPAMAGIPASLEAPPDRPARFVTVERTGGGGSRHTVAPQVAFQCWADTRLMASRLADMVAHLVSAELPYAPPIRSVSVNSVADFPLDGRTPRYQVLADLIYQP